MSGVIALTSAALSCSALAPYLRIGRITGVTTLTAEHAKHAENALLLKPVYYPLDAIPRQQGDVEI
jgi:hypothetical protein